MSNVVVVTIAWAGFLVHLVVTLLARRRVVEAPLVPLLNLATSGLVLAYWAQRWYGYVFHGITWYVTDQFLPLYALLVCLLAAVAIWSRSTGGLQWTFLTIDGVALFGAAIFFSMVRLDRMF